MFSSDDHGIHFFVMSKAVNSLAMLLLVVAMVFSALSRTTWNPMLMAGHQPRGVNAGVIVGVVEGVGGFLVGLGRSPTLRC